MCSINLQHILLRKNRSVISGSFLDPFLCNGVTFATLLLSGTVPVLRETMNMLQRTGAIWQLNSLRIQDCRLSISSIVYSIFNFEVSISFPDQSSEMRLYPWKQFFSFANFRWKGFADSKVHLAFEGLPE